MAHVLCILQQDVLVFFCLTSHNEFNVSWLLHVFLKMRDYYYYYYYTDTMANSYKAIYIYIYIYIKFRGYKCVNACNNSEELTNEERRKLVYVKAL